MSSNTERKVFLTFGGGKTWPSAARRLKKQAEDSGMFDDVLFETSENFFTDNPDFLMHKPFIERNPRGWGYWIWKPFLVLKYLTQLEDGDSLFYLDAGCEILPENGAEFKSLFDHLAVNGSAFFDYSEFPIFNLPFWTKQSLLNEIQNEFSVSDYLTIPKITAGCFGLVRNAKNIAFLRDWYRLAIKDNYHLVDDTPSPVPQTHPIFEHRHDQSIMSALKFIYKFPNYRSASLFDYIDLGVDCLPLAQPFLMSRNPTGTSKVEEFKSNPLPARKTTSTTSYAISLTNQNTPLLASLGLIHDWKQPRSTPCYCRSGKRFKHCHGALGDKSD